MNTLPPDKFRKSNQQIRNSPPLDSVFASLTHFLNRVQISPETVVLVLGVIIGSSTGMGVVTFHYLIQLFSYTLYEQLLLVIGGWGMWTLAIVPVIGGIAVGLMRWRSQDFGPSLSSLIALSQGNSLQRPLRPVMKMVAAAFSLGSGASLGPEGPSVEIGANFGMLLSQILKVSRERQRLLLGAGAAAGLAAGFNAPIAGVFFALEVVLGATSLATTAVSVVVLAAVLAALIAQIGLGSQPAFALTAYQTRGLLELPLYLGLGLAASQVSLAYTQALKFAKASFAGKVSYLSWLGRIPRYFHPTLGGVIVGVVALQFPQILGIGYSTIQAMLQGMDMSWQLLAGLLICKLLMTAISAGSGFVGGVFAPAMFLGATLGVLYAKVIHLLIPQISMYMAAPPAYAMVGMAAVLAASVRAPLTSILLLFELTHDYRIVLPLMAAVGLSFWLVETIKPRTDANSNLQQIGLSELGDDHAEIIHQITVAQAMQTNPMILPATMNILETAVEMSRSRIRSALVIDEQKQLIGIISLEDINRYLTIWQENPPSPSIPILKDICTTEIIYAYSDESLFEALNRMTLRGLHQLPVVKRNHHESILGLLERSQIPLACNLTLTRNLLKNFPVIVLENEHQNPPLTQLEYQAVEKTNLAEPRIDIHVPELEATNLVLQPNPTPSLDNN